MKIWIIGRGYPTTANKMWGSFELEQAKLLARNGHEVSYIALTLSFFDRQDKRGLNIFTEEQVSVFAYSHFYFPGKAGIYLEHFEDRCWRKLFDQAEKKSGKPDIIHVHYPSMISSINEIEKYRKQGVCIIATEHLSRVLINTLKPFERRRLQYYAANANCFVSVSRSLLDAAKEIVPFSVPTKIVPNIISPVFFSKKPASDPKRFRFVTVGRLVPLKQFDKVIKAFQDAFPNSDDVELRIIGSGSERKHLEELAVGSKHIQFLGEISLEKVAKTISESDVLVSFSKYETFAAPVAEAWACGKPAIVSEQSGIAPYVNEKNGIVVSMDSPEQLREAMQKIRKTYSNYKADDIRSYAAQLFNDTAVMSKLYKIYTVYGDGKNSDE